MARMARLKITDDEGWYHLHARVAAVRGRYHLAAQACQRKLIELFQKYCALYMCQVAAFCVMGNHWHLLVRFSAPSWVSSEDLWKIARGFYPGKAGEKKLANWGQEEWERFERRIFDVSELMRNVQAGFATWYNRTYDRRGRFWADRFGSTLLGNLKAVLDCMMYIELNPVRAGLVERPEDYRASSCYLRSIGLDDGLMSMGSLLESDDEVRARSEYREMLYWRGTEPSRAGQARIPRRLAELEAGLEPGRSGAFLHRLRYFTDGLVVGAEAFVAQQLTRLRRAGRYRRRDCPIAIPGSSHLKLREQYPRPAAN